MILISSNPNASWTVIVIVTDFSDAIEIFLIDCVDVSEIFYYVSGCEIFAWSGCEISAESGENVIGGAMISCERSGALSDFYSSWTVKDCFHVFQK